MPKNRPKTKKVVKKGNATKRATKHKKERKAQPVKNTYDEWISKQVRSSKRKIEAHPQPAHENPLDTFNEWMKKQKVRGTTSEQKTVEIPQNTYELWMARQIRERGSNSESSEEGVESVGSTQLLSVSQKEEELSEPGEAS